MSNTSNTPTVEELQAEIDRLNSELANKPTGEQASPAAAVNTSSQSGPGVYREPGSGAKVIGASSDPRGGHVIGYSDGTVKLLDVPGGPDGALAEPFGSAPEGDYVQFFVDDNGNRYNWLASDGSSVASVDNPNQARP